MVHSWPLPLFGAFNKLHISWESEREREFRGDYNNYNKTAVGSLGCSLGYSLFFVFFFAPKDWRPLRCTNKFYNYAMRVLGNLAAWINNFCTIKFRFVVQVNHYYEERCTRCRETIPRTTKLCASTIRTHDDNIVCQTCTLHQMPIQSGSRRTWQLVNGQWQRCRQRANIIYYWIESCSRKCMFYRKMNADDGLQYAAPFVQRLDTAVEHYFMEVRSPVKCAFGDNLCFVCSCTLCVALFHFFTLQSENGSKKSRARRSPKNSISHSSCRAVFAVHTQCAHHKFVAFNFWSKTLCDRIENGIHGARANGVQFTNSQCDSKICHNFASLTNACMCVRTHISLVLVSFNSQKCYAGWASSNAEFKGI